ncbi:MAG: triose-phosphate isomerase [Bdellovibrionales bacterium RBG_16_40_8]|nr:MAG: triose-phosphate isomerase [Bdellovibrionales bacterium RBG_16_40_8]
MVQEKKSIVREKICAGNWKMYKTPDETTAYFQEFSKIKRANLENANSKNVKIIFFPPAYNLLVVKSFAEELSFSFGPQNIHFEKEGAFTGENSATAAKLLGASYALIGHSERRTLFQETDMIVAKKMQCAAECGLLPMLCVGETLPERESDRTSEVVLKQLKIGLSQVLNEISSGKTLPVVAYEPVWAIGTGKVATPEQAEQVHSFIRQSLGELVGSERAQSISILYGGSVKPDNAAGLAIQPNIDGFLVGGASLKPKDFAAISAAL